MKKVILFLLLLCLSACSSKSPEEAALEKFISEKENHRAQIEEQSVKIEEVQIEENFEIALISVKDIRNWIDDVSLKALSDEELYSYLQEKISEIKKENKAVPEDYALHLLIKLINEEITEEEFNKKIKEK